MALSAIASWITYILLLGGDTAINQLALPMLIGAGVTLITSYVFGAVKDDKNYMDTVTNILANRGDDGSSSDCKTQETPKSQEI